MRSSLCTTCTHHFIHLQPSALRRRCLEPSPLRSCGQEHGGKCAVVNVQHADSALTGPVRQLDYIATQSSRGVLLGSHLPSDPAGAPRVSP